MAQGRLEFAVLEGRPGLGEIINLVLDQRFWGARLAFGLAVELQVDETTHEIGLRTRPVYISPRPEDQQFLRNRHPR